VSHIKTVCDDDVDVDDDNDDDDVCCKSLIVLSFRKYLLRLSYACRKFRYRFRVSYRFLVNRSWGSSSG